MGLITWALGNLPGLVAVLCAFGFIIFIHELGHFLAARRVGIRCPNFAIGFGPRLFAFSWRGTEFSVRLLPFGGFVQMLGEDPAVDEAGLEFAPVSRFLGEELFPAARADLVRALEARGAGLDDPAERARHLQVLEHVRWGPDRVYATLRDLEGNFNDRTIPQRMMVIVGGVTMNFLSALILFWGVGWAYGLVDLSQDSLPRVMKVYAGSPADVAGLRYGDEVQAVNGTQVLSGRAMIEALRGFPGVPIQVRVTRGGEPVELSVTPNAQVAGMTFHPDHQLEGGAQVVELDGFGASEGPAARAGIRKGDVITHLDGRPVTTVAELVAGFEAARERARAQGAQQVSVELTRRGGQGPVRLELGLAEARPEGKIGIIPGLVTEFRFLPETTREVLAVAPGSPAQVAGFQPGDHIYEVNGRSVRDRASLDEILALAGGASGPGGAPAPGDAPARLEVEVARAGAHVSLNVPAAAASTAEALGLSFQPVTMGRVVSHSFALIGKLIVAPLTIVALLVQKLLNPSVVAAGMSGPIGIMQMIFELSEQGLGKFLYVVALINAAVGAFNLIPFPALDGSRLLILAIGAVRRREVDGRLEARIHYLGLMVLLAVVLLVTVMDIQRIWAGMPLTK